MFPRIDSSIFCIVSLVGTNDGSDAPTDFLDRVIDVSNQNRVLLTFFLDFFKAFDTVYHEILLKKIVLLWL